MKPIVLRLAVMVPWCFLPNVAAQSVSNTPAQAVRGEELFFQSAKPWACGTCHSLGGKGTAVGPDLMRWGRLNPRATAMAITSTITVDVVWVEPKAGAAFPAFKVSEEGGNTQFYDLGKEPPALLKLGAAEVRAVKPNATWKHPPSQAKHTPEQIADMIAFIRWAGAKDTKGVKPEDVQ
jgi:mono/diheme cytochrome c family protein